MGFVPITCTRCGAALTDPPLNDEHVCRFCGNRMQSTHMHEAPPLSGAYAYVTRQSSVEVHALSDGALVSTYGDEYYK